MKNYRIYINDNALTITDLMPIKSDGIERLNVEEFDFQSFYRGLENVSGKEYALLCEKPKKLFKEIKNSCVLIKAAGGLVRNEKGDYLFIFRNKKWDLPKGKIEKGEGTREAGVREVEEECGIKILKNEDKICKTYHVYTLGSKLVLKKTYWYSMTVKGTPKLVPQKEEGITKAVWLDKTELDPIIANTYLAIIEVMETASLI